MPSGQACGEGAGQVVRVAVDGLVEAELLREVPQLLRPAGDADHPAASDLRHLARDRADRARRRRDHDRIARRGAADLDQPEIGGEPRHAEDADGGGEWPQCRVHLARARSLRDGVVLPARVVVDDVARHEARVPALHHPADRAAHDHVAERNRRVVAQVRAHPEPHVGVEGEPDRPNQQLAVGRLGHRRLDEAKIRLLWRPFRAGGEDDLAVGVGDHWRAPS